MWGHISQKHMKSETGKENEGIRSALTGLGDQSGWRLEEDFPFFFLVLLFYIL